MFDQLMQAHGGIDPDGDESTATTGIYSSPATGTVIFIFIFFAFLPSMYRKSRQKAVLPACLDSSPSNQTKKYMISLMIIIALCVQQERGFTTNVGMTTCSWTEEK